MCQNFSRPPPPSPKQVIFPPLPTQNHHSKKFGRPTKAGATQSFPFGFPSKPLKKEEQPLQHSARPQKGVLNGKCSLRCPFKATSKRSSDRYVCKQGPSSLGLVSDGMPRRSAAPVVFIRPEGRKWPRQKNQRTPCEYTLPKEV